MKRRFCVLYLFVFATGLFFCNISIAQSSGSGQIVGLAKNNFSQPVPFASISLSQKGRSFGRAVSDSIGKFVFENLKSGYYDIAVTSVGYKSQTTTGYLVKDGETTSVLISLELEEGNLNGVVVTALGISKTKARLGYAVSTIDGALLNQAKETNVAYSLEGRTAGLNVTGLNGGPGSSARILIRGISNFSTSNVGPLIVINGVPMDNTQQGTAGTWGGADMGDGISSINPDDISDVTVLKGSTASALYGSRAANGVILITTKSGKNSQGVGVEFSTNYSVNKIVNNSDFQTTYGAGQFGIRPMTMSDLIGDDLNSWGEQFSSSKTSIEADGQMHPYTPVSNPRDNFYRTAPVVNNTIALSNAGKDGNFRLSLSQLDNQSVMPNSDLVRYTGNLNLNQNITSKLKLSLMADFINENAKNRPFLNDFSRNANFIVQFLPLNVDPNYLKPGWNPATGAESVIDQTGYYGNPWFTAYKLVNNTLRNRFITSTSLRYDLTSDLFAQARLGLDYIVDNTLQYEPTGDGIYPQGKLENQSKRTAAELNTDLLLGYKHKFSDFLGINAALGGSIRKNVLENLGVYNNNFGIPFLYTPSNSSGIGPNYYYSQLQTNSAYYTVDVDIKDFLTLSTTGRYDLFSTLPAANRGIYTPSVSGSFLFNKLVNIPKLTSGKIRISYAQTAADAPPYQDEITYYSLGNINNTPYGARGNTLVNANDVNAYKMKEFEAGFELAFFNNRFGINATYFNRITNNELINRSISPATGFGGYFFPIGSTSNNGIELELSGTPVKQKYFNWNVNFNFTYVANKLVSLGDSSNTAQIYLDQYRPANGGTVWPGDGSYIADIQGLPLSQIMVTGYKYDSKGNIIVQNGIPVAGNVKPVGSGIPKIYGGLNNEFNYKKFSLSFLIDYRFQVKVLSGTNFVSTYYGLNKNTLAGRDNGVLFNGVNIDGTPNTQTVNAQTFYQTLINNVSNLNVFDASFIKLRQITFGYDFSSERLIQKSPFSSIRVSLVARNILTLLKHTPNFDPEDNYSSSLADAGLEGGNLPQVRTLGVNAVFKFKN